ncbi:hypothetical protein J1614_007812 [Plenodomus biglobosus]|nr:hypothetical protein J1614_007812 [Plenodomus biglobosus]
MQRMLVVVNWLMAWFGFEFFCIGIGIGDWEYMGVGGSNYLFLGDSVVLNYKSRSRYKSKSKSKYTSNTAPAPDANPNANPCSQFHVPKLMCQDFPHMPKFPVLAKMGQKPQPK